MDARYVGKAAGYNTPHLQAHAQLRLTTLVHIKTYAQQQLAVIVSHCAFAQLQLAMIFNWGPPAQLSLAKNLRLGGPHSYSCAGQKLAKCCKKQLAIKGLNSSITMAYNRDTALSPLTKVVNYTTP
jgi:hypothetical protein